MSSTNYRNVFIAVAADCPADRAEEPTAGVAAVQFAILNERPSYSITSDDLLFETETRRKGLEETVDARAAFFAKPKACLRASPLPKRHGWGIHHDEAGRIALVGAGSHEYERFASATDLSVVPAMRNKRAG